MRDDQENFIFLDYRRDICLDESLTFFGNFVNKRYRRRRFLLSLRRNISIGRKRNIALSICSVGRWHCMCIHGAVYTDTMEHRLNR